MSTPKIITDFVHPPIPDRRFDWQAWYAGEEDEGMVVGNGRTEDEAIADLIQNHPRDPPLEHPHAPGGLREHLHHLFG